MELEKFPSVEEVRRRIENIPDEKYRNAFKYLYLIAGRVSEVCGKYAPLGRHAYQIEIEGEDAVLFAVRTAKRKKGIYRAVALPLEYEPWAKDVLEYFKREPDKCPFIFIKKKDHKIESNVRMLQWEAERVFKDLTWPIPEYTITREKTSEDESNLGVVFALANRGKVEIEYTPPKTEPQTTEEHVRNFTTLALRYMRAFELFTKYNFNPIELSIYGGWKASTLSFSAPSFLDRYFGIKTTEPNESLLRMMAEIYFRKLLKPR